MDPVPWTHCIERLWRTIQLVWRPRVLNLVHCVLNLVHYVLSLVPANLNLVHKCTKFSTSAMPDSPWKQAKMY